MTRAEAQAILEVGRLFVVFDPRFPGIDVHAPLFSAPKVTLMFSHLFDTTVDLCDDYIAQNLSFKGDNHLCHVPLAAVIHFYGAEHDLQPAPVPTAPKLRLVGDDD